MKNKSGGFVQIVIILAVLFLIGGAYYFGTLKNKAVSTISVVSVPTPTSSVVASTKPGLDPTMDWKIFNNITMLGYKYSVKYPLNYSVVADSKLVDQEENNKNVCITSLKNFCQLRINVFKQEGSYELKNWVAQNRSYIDQNWSKPFSISDYKILSYASQGQMIVFLQNADYVIEIIAPDDNLHHQILSTFRFAK
jgi:hypothetical protein